jgi:hypothetical protein
MVSAREVQVPPLLLERRNAGGILKSLCPRDLK